MQPCFIIRIVQPSQHAETGSVKCKYRPNDYVYIAKVDILHLEAVCRYTRKAIIHDDTKALQETG